MRVIAGKHKGRKIELLKEAAAKVRPTSDFAREAVFNILTHGNIAAKYSFVGKNVLDVFCGTGAMGIEALSRGAGSVTFVDMSRDAIGNVRHNISRIGELENAEFIQANVTKIGRARKNYSLIFIDPPYLQNLITPALNSLHEGGWFALDSIIVIEHDEKEEIKIPDIFEVVIKRRYGRAVVELLQIKQ